jgi:hypothetical protein
MSAAELAAARALRRAAGGGWHLDAGGGSGSGSAAAARFAR